MMLMFYGHKYFAITPLNCKIRLISAFQSFVGTQKRAHQDISDVWFYSFHEFWLVAKDLNSC